MRDKVIYVGIFKLPDGNAAAICVRGVADALNAAGYAVTLVGNNYTGPAGSDRTRPTFQRLSIVVRRALDVFITSSSYFRQLESVDWQCVAAVICYPGSAALVWRLMHICRKHAVPLIIHSVEWYDPKHTIGGRFGPFALDSEFRMRWLQQRAGNVMCISSYLTQYYAGKGCNVIRIPPVIGIDMERDCARVLAVPAISLGHVSLVYAGVPGGKELFGEIVAGVNAARRRGIGVSLSLVGVTKGKLSEILRDSGAPEASLDNITCHGWLPRREQALQIVADSDFSVILRDTRQSSTALFPLKFVESYCLGVPVIANATSDIAEYLRDGREGYLLSEPTAAALEEAIVRASQLTASERGQMRSQARLRAEECFGYQKFAQPLGKFISRARSPS
jgi:glycosyltransferase involved in cell wall biosynthesis